MATDMRKLKAFMSLHGYSQTSLAEAMGLSRTTMSAKLTGKSSFNTKQIRHIIKLLEIPLRDVGYIFYSP